MSQINVGNTCRECSAHSELLQYVITKTHWALCKKYGVKVCERWHEHKVECIIEKDIVKILWDVCIQVDRQIENRRSDIVVMEKNTKKC